MREETSAAGGVSKQSCVRGYHVWVAVISGELVCQRERGNYHDHYAAAVMKDDVVGHLLQRITRVLSLFIRRGGTIRELSHGKMLFFLFATKRT